MRASGAPILVDPAHRAISLERVPLTPQGESSFDEPWLQRLIHSHPSCLPVAEIEPGFETLIPVCMELPTPHGNVDNFLLSGAGDIAIVETKLWRNPEARRKVIAQALDYASCLFQMDYAELEAAALRGDFGDQARPIGLYELLSEHEQPAESAFVDAINTNLRRGRILILVVGDGIRTEAERLVDSLQSHAGFHFTLALLELAVFRVPETESLLISPRTLAKTCMIDRGVVTIDDQRASVQEAATTAPAGGPQRTSITAEQFYEAMEALQPGLADQIRSFLAELEPLGVRPDYQQTLNLKWDPPEGKPINLGYIKRDGRLWTDASNWFAPHDLSHLYNEELAEAFGVEVRKDAPDGNWYLHADGHLPRIQDLAPHFPAWKMVIERFLERLRRRTAEMREA